VRRPPFVLGSRGVMDVQYTAMRSNSDSLLVLRASPGLLVSHRHQIKADSTSGEGLLQTQTPQLDLEEGLGRRLLGAASVVTARTPWPLRISWLLIPVALIWRSATPIVFWLCFGALLPLSQLIGDFTDDLAEALRSDKLSGLVSASLGNLVELIMSFTLIRGGEHEVLKLSLIGSILSNAGLVFGTSLLCAALARRREGRPALLAFDPADAALHGCGLLLAAAAFWLHGDASGSSLGVAWGTAGLLLVFYLADVVLQLFPAEGEGREDSEEGEAADGRAACVALGCLGATALITCLVSDNLTAALDTAVGGPGISKRFVGAVLLPIAGNACEHATAIRFAVQDRADLALGVSLGSAVQVALFAYPCAVFLAIPYGGMDFDCGSGPARLLLLCAVLLLAVVGDGKGTAQEGLALVCFYGTAALYFLG